MNIKLNKKLTNDIFLICPVRNADEGQKEKIHEYLKNKELEGKTVYYPARDTNQMDDTGFTICKNNAEAIRRAKEVHIFYDPQSQGSLFDLGVAFALHKPLVIINPKDVIATNGKSFANMITRWSLEDL